MKYIERNNLIIVGLVALFMVVTGISSVNLLDPDEPVYAETAREMLQYHDWLSPRIFDEFWYDKPPMYYWLVAICQSIFGVGEFAARFPASLMGALTVVAVYIGTTPLLGERTGFFSSLVLATSLQFFYMGKAAVTDTTLLFFMTSALLCFMNKRYWLAYICCGLATVTKGPIGIVFPGTIILLYLILRGRFMELFTKIHLVRGLLLYFLVASPWYYAMYAVHGMEFIDTFLGFHNITRFTTPEHSNRVTFWFYFPVVILGMFPWTGLLLQSFKNAWFSSRMDELEKLSFMHVWAFFVFIFFTVCKTKLTSYILPMWPPMAILVGWQLAYYEGKQRHNSSYFSWAVGSGIIIGILGIGWFVGARFLPEATMGMYMLGGLTLLILGAIIYTLLEYKDVALAALLHCALGAVTMVMAFVFIFPQIQDRFSVRTMAEYYKTNVNHQLPIHVDKFLRPGFKYYSDTNGIELLPRTEAFRKTLASEGHVYIMIRRMEINRDVKQNGPLPNNVTVIKEHEGIVLLKKE